MSESDYCVFRANVAGSRQNKLVLVQHSGICDPDTGFMIVTEVVGKCGY